MLTSVNGLNIYTAQLDYPTGVNATYACGRNFYKNQKAKDWLQKAVADLRKQGFKPVENTVYWCSVRYLLYTVKMDVDGPSKAIIDAIAEALSLVEMKINVKGKPFKSLNGFNDKWVGELEARKQFSKKADQGLLLEVLLVKTNEERRSEIQKNLLSRHTTRELLTDMAKQGLF
jgi:hypothetical protein